MAEAGGHHLETGNSVAQLEVAERRYCSERQLYFVISSFFLLFQVARSPGDSILLTFTVIYILLCYPNLRPTMTTSGFFSALQVNCVINLLFYPEVPQATVRFTDKSTPKLQSFLYAAHTSSLLAYRSEIRKYTRKCD